MGLDMYLKGCRGLSPTFRESDREIQKAVEAALPEINWQTNWEGSPIKEIEVEVGYWRKANAVHAWFVREVQEGEDNCGSYWVSREQLASLRRDCQEALEGDAQARELLPTQEGFFFGATDYDDWYRGNLVNTIQIIDRALALPPEWEFEYQSSW